MKKITISLLGALWFNFYFISETNKFGKKILPLYFCWFCSLWFDKLLLLFQNYKFSNIFHSPINPLWINSKFQINISFVSNLDYCLFQIIWQLHNTDTVCNDDRCRYLLMMESWGGVSWWYTDGYVLRMMEILNNDQWHDLLTKENPEMLSHLKNIKELYNNLIV